MTVQMDVFSFIIAVILSASLSLFIIWGLLNSLGVFRRQGQSFLNGPFGPWAGPMNEMGMAVLSLRRPPFFTFRDLGGPQAFTVVPICAQQWAETASKGKIRRLLQAVRKEAEFCLVDHRQQGEIYWKWKGQEYLTQLIKDDAVLLLAILDGKILIRGDGLW